MFLFALLMMAVSKATPAEAVFEAQAMNAGLL
jgi:hypothetical protein